MLNSSCLVCDSKFLFHFFVRLVLSYSQVQHCSWHGAREVLWDWFQVQRRPSWRVRIIFLIKQIDNIHFYCWTFFQILMKCKGTKMKSSATRFPLSACRLLSSCPTPKNSVCFHLSKHEIKLFDWIFWFRFYICFIGTGLRKTGSKF